MNFSVEVEGKDIKTAGSVNCLERLK
jgi:hypothetical protein